MKSTAHIKGHPLHPMLIPFPIAFFIGTLIVDILGLIFSRPDFRITAELLTAGGIVFALLAAIPGIIDYLLTVPPNSSAKKRGAKHGILNISVVIIFLIALVLRMNQQASFTFVFILEIVGVILLGFSGWMGGTLVYRNQIGVNPRYAHAGKWKEEYIEQQSKGSVKIATRDELQVNQMKLLHIGDKRIVFCRTDDGFAAFDDRCTHKGGSLAGGSMICNTVQCPWHGSQFDVLSGEVKSGPAKDRIKIYPLTESNGNLYINV